MSSGLRELRMTTVAQGQIYRVDVGGPRWRRVRVVRRSTVARDEWVCEDLQTGKTMLLKDTDLREKEAASGSDSPADQNG